MQLLTGLGVSDNILPPMENEEGQCNLSMNANKGNGQVSMEKDDNVPKLSKTILDWTMVLHDAKSS